VRNVFGDAGVTAAGDGRQRQGLHSVRGEWSFDVADTERTALLVIRGWRRQAGEPVVRVIRVDELPGGTAISTVLAGRAELISEVGEWFDTFAE
jgi:hypothetical protein